MRKPIPLLPQAFWGEVEVDGEPAPDGTVISAFMEGYSPHVHTIETKDGKYGTTGFGDKLFLSNTDYWEYLIGNTIHFLIMLPTTRPTDKIVKIANETSEYNSQPRELNLSC